MPRGYSSKQLTRFLRELANDPHTYDFSDERSLTKAEALAVLLWNKALGFSEPDPDNKGAIVNHKPEAWAIQLLWERLEGKAPAAVEEQSQTMTAAAKVGELAKSRINSEAAASLAVSEHTGPVDVPDNGPESPERPGSEFGVEGKTFRTG